MIDGKSLEPRSLDLKKHYGEMVKGYSLKLEAAQAPPGRGTYSDRSSSRVQIMIRSGVEFDCKGPSRSRGSEQRLQWTFVLYMTSYVGCNKLRQSALREPLQTWNNA